MKMDPAQMRIIEELRGMAIDGWLPAASKLAKGRSGLYERARRSFGSIYAAASAAGLTMPRIERGMRDVEIIEKIRAIARDGLMPIRGEIIKAYSTTFYGKIYHRWGGIREAAKACGLSCEGRGWGSGGAFDPATATPRPGPISRPVLTPYALALVKAKNLSDRLQGGGTVRVRSLF